MGASTARARVKFQFANYCHFPNTKKVSRLATRTCDYAAVVVRLCWIMAQLGGWKLADFLIGFWFKDALKHIYRPLKGSPNPGWTPVLRLSEFFWRALSSRVFHAKISERTHDILSKCGKTTAHYVKIHSSSIRRPWRGLDSLMVATAYCEKGGGRKRLDVQRAQAWMSLPSTPPCS